MLDHLSIRQGSQVGDTQINAHILIRDRQLCRLLDFAREHDEPLIDFPLHRDCLHLALDFAMKPDLDIPNLGEMQRAFERVPLLFYVQLPACPIRVGEAIIAVWAFEAWKPCSIKETLECPLYPQDH